KSAQPMNHRTRPLASMELFCASIAFLVALFLYSWTLAPTVTLTDSGELIVVAHGLGVAHPPGFPLWVILALFASLASAMLTLVVAELMIAASYLAASKRKKKGAQQRKKAAPYTTVGANDEDSATGRLLVLAPALS